MSTLDWYGTSGFVARGGRPTPEDAGAWIAWHMTLAENLSAIVQTGAILSDAQAPEHANIGDLDIKAKRMRKEVTADGYPPGRKVGEHVPFYLASKSPMLYRRRSEQNRLVFLGVCIRDAAAAGLEWVGTDGNAWATLTAFTIDLVSYGTLVDHDVLRAQDYRPTIDDVDRYRRRQAEFLVYDRVPLGVVSVVAARIDSTLEAARNQLDGLVANDAIFRTQSGLYYPD